MVVFSKDLCSNGKDQPVNEDLPSLYTVITSCMITDDERREVYSVWREREER